MNSPQVEKTGKTAIATDSSRKAPLGNQDNYRKSCWISLLPLFNTKQILAWKLLNTIRIARDLDNGDTNQQITSIFLVLAFNAGEIIGAVLGGYLMYGRGRIFTLYIGSVIITILTTPVCFIDKSSEHLLHGVYFTVGIPCSLAPFVAPHYLVEVIPIARRPTAAAYIVIIMMLGSFHANVESYISGGMHSLVTFVSSAIIAILFVCFYMKSSILEPLRYLHWKDDLRAKMAFHSCLYKTFDLPDRYPYPPVEPLKSNVKLIILITVSILFIFVVFIELAYNLFLVHGKFSENYLENIFESIMSAILALLFGYVFGKVFSHKIFVAVSTTFISLVIGLFILLQNELGELIGVVRVVCSIAVQSAVAMALLPTFFLRMTTLFPMADKGIMSPLPLLLPDSRPKRRF